MKRNLLFIFSLFSISLFGQGDLIITAAFDGPRTGGVPKGVEIYAKADIADLSEYGIGSANNGQGTDGEEYTFPSMMVTAGTFLYVSSDSMGFIDFFGFETDFNAGAAMGINGDDAIELFHNGAVIDIFGDIDVDGNGTPWEYLDGWAYRVNGTGGDGSNFVLANWSFSGVDALDGESTNATAATPVPIGTYTSSPNTMLVANDDFITVEINESFNINTLALANDIIPSGVVDSFGVSGSTFTLGTVGLMGSDFLYEPLMDTCGMDTITYTVCEVGQVCESAEIFITINCPTVYTPRTIAEVRMLDQDGVSVLDGESVTITGVVHSLNFRGGGLQFLILDTDIKGITVFSGSDDLGYTVKEGDEVSIDGNIGQFRGTTQLYADAIRVNSADNTLFDPTKVVRLSEFTENQLVTLEGLTLVNPAQWSPGGSGFNVDMTNGPDTFLIRIDDDSELFSAPVPEVGVDIVYTVTGVGSQFDANAPYDTGYQLLPRYNTDIEKIFVNSTNNPDWAKEITVSPNPALDFLNVKGLRNVDRFLIFNSIGQKVLTCEDPGFNHSTPVGQLDSGFYIIIFEKEGQRSNMTFVKS